MFPAPRRTEAPASSRAPRRTRIRKNTFATASGFLAAVLATTTVLDPVSTGVLAQIRIQSPHRLQEQVFHRQKLPGYIQGSTATFGAPYYGLRVIGRVLYAESKGDDYCHPDDYELPGLSQPQGADVKAGGAALASPGSAGIASSSGSSNQGSATSSANHAAAVGEGEGNGSKQINIVLVHRGKSKCRFTRKVCCQCRPKAFRRGHSQNPSSVSKFPQSLTHVQKRICRS